MLQKLNAKKDTTKTGRAPGMAKLSASFTIGVPM